MATTNSLNSHSMKQNRMRYANEKFEKEIAFQKREFGASAVEFRARNPRCLACLEGAIDMVARMGFQQPFGINRATWMEATIVCCLLSFLLLLLGCVGLWGASEQSIVSFNWMHNYELGFYMTLSGYYTSTDTLQQGTHSHIIHELRASWATCSPTTEAWVELPDNWARVCSRCGSDRGFAVVCFLVGSIATLSEVSIACRRRVSDPPLEKFSAVTTCMTGFGAVITMTLTVTYGCMGMVKTSFGGSGAVGPGYILCVLAAILRFIGLLSHLLLAADVEEGEYIDIDQVLNNHYGKKSLVEPQPAYIALAEEVVEVEDEVEVEEEEKNEEEEEDEEEDEVEKEEDEEEEVEEKEVDEEEEHVEKEKEVEEVEEKEVEEKEVEGEEVDEEEKEEKKVEKVEEKEVEKERKLEEKEEKEVEKVEEKEVEKEKKVEEKEEKEVEKVEEREVEKEKKLEEKEEKEVEKVEEKAEEKAEEKVEEKVEVGGSREAEEGPQGGLLVHVTLASKSKLGISLSNDEYGVMVSAVEPHSQAHVLGIREGDNIVKLNDELVHLHMNHTDVGQMMRDFDRPLRLLLERFEYDEEPSEIIEVGKMPEEIGEKADINLLTREPLGIYISGDNAKKRLFVTGVENGEYGAKLGISSGDEIMAVNGVLWAETSGEGHDVPKEDDDFDPLTGRGQSAKRTSLFSALGASSTSSISSPTSSSSSALPSPKKRRVPTILATKKGMKGSPSDLFADVLSHSARPLRLTLIKGHPHINPVPKRSSMSPLRVFSR